VSLYNKPNITRQIKIDDLTPEELAALFMDMFGNEQARFFDEVWSIALKWPEAGWCQQFSDVVTHLGNGGRQAVEVMASHITPETE
jgi:hypothetical protein